MLLVGLLFVVLNRVPKSYPPTANPFAPPTPTDYAASKLDGFESPYLDHTGSWDGKGGNMWGGSKVPDLDKEVEMGLRWTFMPVNWSAMEPEGPVNEPEMYRTHWKGQAADYAEFVTLVQVDGSESVPSAPGHWLTLELKGDRKMAPPVIVVDRSIEGTGGRSADREEGTDCVRHGDALGERVRSSSNAPRPLCAVAGRWARRALGSQPADQGRDPVHGRPPRCQANSHASPGRWARLDLTNR